MLTYLVIGAVVLAVYLIFMIASVRTRRDPGASEGLADFVAGEQTRTRHQPDRAAATRPVAPHGKHAKGAAAGSDRSARAAARKARPRASQANLIDRPPGHSEFAKKLEGDAGFPNTTGNMVRPPLPNSSLLRQAPGDAARRAKFALPPLETLDDLLRWLEIDIRSFVALANVGNRVRPNRTNYAEWTVPKRRGGVRIICSPKPRLRSIQQKIKREILDRVPLHDAAHGFVRGRNIVSNASPHVARPLVLNLDLRHFFEHVTYRRVLCVFRGLGFSLVVSRALALLCTHRPVLCAAVPAERGKPKVWCVRRHTVQGAPTSPGLANLACERLDRRMAGLARRFAASYTRYADDLTFSGGEPFKRGMKRFLALVDRIVREEGFRLHRGKRRFMRPGHRQEVTGVVVNHRVNSRRRDYDLLKAIVHNAKKAGTLASQNRAGVKNFKAWLLGKAAQLRQLNAERGERLRAQIRSL